MQKLNRANLWSLEEYAEARPEFRTQVMAHKKPRRIPIGEHATLYFEDFLTMKYQVQEMLRTERIFEAAGIEEEIEAYNPLIPDGTNLKATFIVHAVGPRFNEDDTEGKLRTTVLNSLRAAEAKHVKRIALPPMGAGFYMVPLDLCARVMVEAILSYLTGETGIEEVVLCVRDQREFVPFEAQLAARDRQKG